MAWDQEEVLEPDVLAAEALVDPPPDEPPDPPPAEPDDDVDEDEDDDEEDVEEDDDESPPEDEPSALAGFAVPPPLPSAPAERESVR
ncbi:hypothetical protein [Micromonospora sp. NPDC092111]|uniref:hypothetical protein n=1 Tax=Micromonospora sp. NPDC092111 TaxID=3364289 RepID=UPI0038169355